jgi:hypothetical protein
MPVLWVEFQALQPGEGIKGCKTRNEFIETHLGVSRATVYRKLNKARRLIEETGESVDFIRDYVKKNTRPTEEDDETAGACVPFSPPVPGS